MKLSRRGKLLRNLVVCLFCLFVLWQLADQPLPLRWAYRQAEKAYFLDRKTILCQWDEETLFSRDPQNLYFYRNGSIRQISLEKGRAFAMAKSGEGDILIYAYDESGETARVSISYEIQSEHWVPLQYAETAESQGNFTQVPLSRQVPLQQKDRTEDQTQEAVWQAELYGFYSVIDAVYFGQTIHNDYRMTLTYSDASGAVLDTVILEGGNWNGI